MTSRHADASPRTRRRVARIATHVSGSRSSPAGSPGLLGAPADARILQLAGNALDLLRRSSDGAAGLEVGLLFHFALLVRLLRQFEEA